MVYFIFGPTYLCSIPPSSIMSWAFQFSVNQSLLCGWAGGGDNGYNLRVMMMLPDVVFLGNTPTVLRDTSGQLACHADSVISQ